MTRPDVSVVIVSFNTKDLTRQCLRSVLDETRGIETEIFVVDNASKDGSVDMIRTEFPTVRLIANPDNKGFAAANNQAIRLARGRYVLLLNSDTVVLDNAIAKTVACADRHPEGAVFGCRLLNPDGTLQDNCFLFPSLLNLWLSSTYLYKIFPRSRFFGRQHMQWWSRDDTREVDVVFGCFMLVRAQALATVGLLDEAFFIFGEETDWCYRFKKAGWRVIFTADAQIIHYGGQSTKAMASAMILQLGASHLQFMRKHYSRIEYYLACLLMWLNYALRVPGWTVMYVLGKERREVSWVRLSTYLRGMWLLATGGGQALCVCQKKECRDRG